MKPGLNLPISWSNIIVLVPLNLGTLGNAGKAPDKGLATKLRPLVKALRDSDKLVQEAATELDAMEWDATKLCRGGGDTPTPTNGPPSTILPPAQPDPLDQLIACARALTEDVRQVASFIQVNGTTLPSSPQLRKRGQPTFHSDPFIPSYIHIHIYIFVHVYINSSESEFTSFSDHRENSVNLFSRSP